MQKKKPIILIDPYPRTMDLLFSKKNFEYLKKNFTLITAPKKNNTFQLKKLNHIKIGFGSCLKQDKSMLIFESIKEESFDLFLMIGDNVYGDSETKDLEELKLAYEQQKANFEMMRLDFPFEAIWDDHDYGMNDAGKEYPYKENSKELDLEECKI